MKKLVLVAAGVVAGLTIGVAVGVQAVSTLSDGDLLSGMKSLFLQAGWTPPVTTPIQPPPVPQTTPTGLVGSLWTVTGPFNKPGETNNPQNEYLSVAQTDPAFTPYMYMNGSILVFKTPVNGVTTSGSDYPRTELREMKDTNWTDASWSDKAGTNTLTVREAIAHEPVVKPEVVAAQIHDSSDDVIQVFLQGSTLYVRYNNDKSLALMDSDYILGTPYNLQVTATGGHIKVFYNSVQKLDFSKTESGLYYKVGSYCQSNLAHGESANAYCEVDVYSLEVAH